MDIRQCCDHMDIRRAVTALQSRHLPMWLVSGFERELCHLKAKARIADADWTPDFEFSKGRKTGGVDTLALLDELMQHHLSTLAEQWHMQRTGYIIGGDGDDPEMNHAVLSHLCWVDNIWLFAPNTCTLQTMVDDLTHRLHHDFGIHWKPKSLQIMCAAHVPRKDRNGAKARALEPCRSMKVLGSWCDDCGASPGHCWPRETHQHFTKRDRGCLGHHLHKERAQASTHQSSLATAQVGTSGSATRSSLALQRRSVVGTDAEKMRSTVREGLWSGLEAVCHGRRRSTVARVTLGLRQNNSQKLQNPHDVDAPQKRAGPERANVAGWLRRTRAMGETTMASKTDSC